MFLGSRGIFLKKANHYYILFWGCIVKTKMVVGSPGIVADTSYDVINMAPVKSLIWGKFIIIVKHRRFRYRFYVSQKLIMHKRHKRTVQSTQMICVHFNAFLLKLPRHLSRKRLECCKS